MEVWRPCLQRGPGAEPLAFLTVKLNVGWYNLAYEAFTAYDASTLRSVRHLGAELITL